MSKLLRLLKQKTLMSSLITMLSGNVLASALGVLSTSITAKSLGVELFGYLILALTITTVSHKIFDCQTWQAFIRFYSRLSAKNKKIKRFLIKFFIYIEVISILLALSLLVVLNNFYISLFSVPENYGFIFLFYAITIFFKFTGVSIGVLRFYSKFFMISKIQVATSAIKLLLVAFCSLYLKSDELYLYMFVWVLSDILLSIMLGGAAFIIYKNENEPPCNSKGKISVKYKKIVLKFCLFTNLSSTVDLPIKEFDVLMLGAITGSSTAGVYKIAKQIMGLIANVASPLYQVIYPELAKKVIVSKINALKFCNKIAVYTFFTSFIMGAFLIVTLKYWVVLLFGVEFLDYTSLIYVAIIFKSLDIVFTSYHALFIALGYVYDNFLILFFVNSAAMVVAFFSIKKFQAEGVFISLFFQMALVLIFKLRKIRCA